MQILKRYGTVLILQVFLGNLSAQAGIWDWLKSKGKGESRTPVAESQPITAQNEDILLSPGRFERRLAWPELKNLRIENLHSEVTVIPTDADHAILSGELTGKSQQTRLKLIHRDDLFAVQVVYPHSASIPGRSSVTVNGRRYSGNSVSIVASGGKSTVVIDGKVVQDGEEDALVSGDFAFTLHVPRGLLKNLQIEARKITVRDWLDSVARQVDLQFTSELTVSSLAASQGLRAQTTSGRMSLDTVRGSLGLQSSSGAILVTAVDGAVAAQATSGAITLNQVGSAWVDNSSGRVQVQSVDGDLRVQTSSGRQTIGSVKGNVALQASSGAIEVREVGGDLDAETTSGRLEVTGVGGGAVLKSLSGAVTLENARNHVSVETTSGKIQLNNPDALSEKTETISGRVSGKIHQSGPEFTPQAPRQAELCRKLLQEE